MYPLYTVQYHNQSKEFEKSLKYLNMGFTGMFSVETVLKIIGFGVKVGIIKTTVATEPNQSSQNHWPSPQFPAKKPVNRKTDDQFSQFFFLIPPIDFSVWIFY